MNTATRRGLRALQKTKPRNQDKIDALVPVARRLADIWSEEGITVTDIRRHGIRLGILKADDPMDFLPHVPKAAGLVNSGRYKRSNLNVTHGNLQVVWLRPA